MPFTTSTRILLEQTQTLTERQIEQTVDSAIIADDHGNKKPLEMLIRIAMMDIQPVATSQTLIKRELERRGKL